MGVKRMNGKVDVGKSDIMVREIYDNFLSQSPKYKSLDLSEKLQLVSDLKKMILELMEIGDESKLNSLTGQLVLDSINERGPNRLRKFRNYCNNLRETRMEVDFKDPGKREEMLQHFRKIMNTIDLQYKDDDKED